MSSKFFILICGPSGVGKTTLLKYLTERAGTHPKIQIPQKNTTRPKRRTDFAPELVSIDEEHFHQREAQGDYLLVYEDHDHRYGLPKFHIGSDTRIWVQALPSRLADKLSSNLPADIQLDIIRLSTDAKIIHQRLANRSALEDEEIQNVASRRLTALKKSSASVTLEINAEQTPEQVAEQVWSFICERLDHR